MKMFESNEAKLERQMDARLSRRFKAEERYLDRLEKREVEAENMIGELMREGKTVYYVFPVGVGYREGSKDELIAYLIRRNFV